MHAARMRLLQPFARMHALMATDDLHARELHGCHPRMPQCGCVALVGWARCERSALSLCERIAPSLSVRVGLVGLDPLH